MLSISKYLFLLRKLYVTQYFKKSYSQFGEDIALLSLLGKDTLRGYKGFLKNYSGFFVDVGCYHPIKYSNTYALYKKGWRGINIDIDRIKIDGFNIVRRCDTNVVAAVSPQKGEIKVYRFGKYSLLTTLDENTAKEYSEDYGKKFEVDSVAARSLTEIIDGTSYKDKQIDVLTIDAEGHDFEVLGSLDLKRYAPKIILVESHERELIKVLQTKIHKHLDGYGYLLVNWVGFTLFYSSMPVDELHCMRNETCDI